MSKNKTNAARLHIAVQVLSMKFKTRIKQVCKIK